MNGQPINWDWNNLEVVQNPQMAAPQIVPPLNENQINQLFNMLAQQPPVVEDDNVPIIDIREFVDDVVQSLQNILAMYEIEPQEPIELDEGYDPRYGWYARLDEEFDHLSRAVLGYRNTWRPHQELNDLLTPIFMDRHRMGRHIRKEEAQQLLQGFVDFRNRNE
jgi:hypothetical protein